MTDTFNKNKIVKNSLLLYVRMLFTMWLNLWTTRLVLENLGVEDMGVYGVVGSITTLFTVFTNGITTAVQRFLTFELGVKEGRPNIVFCTSLNVIFILCVFLFLLLEGGGLWVLYNKVNIPTDSMQAAFWVYQLSVLTCLVNIISIPYNALVIAHERMNAFAFISILQVVLSCAAAYCLSLFDSGRLIIYAVFCALIGVAIRLLYQVYCHIHFSESRYRFVIQRDIIRQMARFMGINTLSSVLQLVVNQGIVFVINWTFGVVLNAVYNIAGQLRNMVISFAFNIQRAISPQITKTYASGDMEHHRKLVYGGSKLQVYMVYFILIPFLFRTEYIMQLWLGDVPEHAVSFARCTIFASLAYAMLEPVRTAVYATNRIGKFMLIPDMLFILVLPVAYFVSKVTGDADCMMASIIGTEVVVCMLRMWYATRVGSITVVETLKSILFPCALVGVFSAAACFGLEQLLPDGVMGLFQLLLLNSALLCVFIYLLGINKQERYMVNRLVEKVIINNILI